MKPVAESHLLEAIQAVMTDIQGESKPPLITRHTIQERHRELRVLLAEDNPVNCRVATRLLQSRGHTVVAVGDGRAALEALEENPFDIVLMDVQMPEMNGFEVTREIRARERQAGGHLPVLALTAHAMKGDRERCLEAGMDGYVAKPVRPKELLRTIDELVDGRHREPAGEDLPQDPMVLDRDAVLQNAGGDRELIREMVRIFRDETPAMLSDLRDCLGRGDARGLERAAHRLKGSLGVVGGVGATRVALSLEMMGREGCLDGAEAAFLDLEREVGRLRPSLDRLVQGSAR
jgi:CheY-like chemotaxis protein/HPt (histidine-containing phosphotransfer) domain-containing protein